MLWQGIKRHRLESFLQRDPAVGELLPDLCVDLLRAAKREVRAALALASLTREMAVLFEEAGIPLLVIKGIPLALQTTGSLTARGRGDCDLFVDPSQVGAAIELLQSEGFEFSYGASCVGDDSMRGRYSRFVSVEISLQRDYQGIRQFIDLHWQSTWARGILPSFPVLWQRGEEVYVNQQLVRTLSQCDSFVHACCHAAVDRWMILRNLVDIERLQRELSLTQQDELRRIRLVRHSLLALADIMGERTYSWVFGRTQLLQQKAQSAQIRPMRSLGDGEWTLANRLKYFAHMVSLSRHPSHIFSTILRQLVTSDVLMDPQTAVNRSLLRCLLLRAGKLLHRLRAQAESPHQPV